MYDTLAKIFYTDNHNHDRIYNDRFYSPSSVHIPINIRQFNHNKEFPAFFCYNQDLVLLLEKIYSNFSDFLNILTRLNHNIQHQFTLSCIVNEVHSTSDIEGIHSTQRELRNILEGIDDNLHFSSIIKMYDLLSSGVYPNFESCEDIRNFYDEFAHLDAISYNPKNRLDGRLFRKEGVDVKAPSGKTIHRGTEPEEKIIEYLKKALHFLNSDEYPALIRIAVFHYLFVYIHPFYDANGRTARFISSSYIAQHLHTLVALRLSVSIKKNKNRYYTLLKDTDAEINCGDLTPFIYGFLLLIADTLRDMNKKLKSKILQIERMKKLLLSVLPDDKDICNIALCILQGCVFYGQGASINDIISASGRTRNTIKNKLLCMPVRKETKTRMNFYKIDWIAVRYLLKKKKFLVM